MAKTTNIEGFLADLQRYVDTVNRRRAEVPFALKTSIVTEIIRSRSIDTTRFIRAVDFREVEVADDGFRWFIDASRDNDVTYDAFVELPGITRNWSGRFNYLLGIQNVDLQPVFDSYADESFAR